MDSFSADFKTDKSIANISMGFNLINNIRLVDEVDLFLSNIKINLNIKEPTGKKEPSGGLEGTINLQGTSLTLSSKLTKKPEQWELSASINQFNLNNLFRFFQLDDINLPPVVAEKIGVKKTTLTFRPVKANYLKLYSEIDESMSMEIVLQKGSKKTTTTKPQTLSTMTTGAYSSSNTNEEVDSITTTNTVWMGLVGISLDDDFKFAALNKNLAPIDQIPVTDIGLVFSTLDGQNPTTSLSMFKEIGSGSAQVSKGLNVIMGLDLHKCKISNDVGTLADIFLVDNLVVRGFLSSDFSSVGMESFINFNENLNLFERVYFKHVGFEASITGMEPELNVNGGIMVKPDNLNELLFKGEIKLQPFSESPSLGVEGALVGTWEKPFGLKGLRIGDISIRAGLTFPGWQSIIVDNLTLSGELTFDQLYGETTIFVDVNRPQKSGFQARVENLNWSNLVDAFCYGKLNQNVKGLTHVMDEMNSSIDVAEIYIVPTPITTLAGKSLSTGFKIDAQGKIAGKDGKFLVHLDGGVGNFNGFKAEGEIDKISYKEGKVTVFSLTGANNTGNPKFTIDLSQNKLIGAAAGGNTSDKIIYCTAGITILDISSTNALIDLNTKGYSCSIEGKVLGVVEGKLDAQIKEFLNPLENTFVSFSANTRGIEAIKTDVIKKIVDKIDIADILSDKLENKIANSFGVTAITFDYNLSDINMEKGIRANVHFKLLGSDEHITGNIKPAKVDEFIKEIAEKIYTDYKKDFTKMMTEVTGVGKEIGKDVGHAFEKGFEGTATFFKTSLNGIKDLGQSVENLVAGNGERNPIKQNGPTVMIVNRIKDEAIYCPSCDQADSYIRTSVANRSSAQLWQIIPSKDEQYYFIVSAESGRNLQVGKYSEFGGAKIILKDHAGKDRKRERIRIENTGVPGYYYLRFQHNNYKNAASQGKELYLTLGNDGYLFQAENPTEAAMFRIIDENKWKSWEKITLYGLDASGKIYKSTDGGFTFHLPGPPYRLTDIGLYSGSIGKGMWGIGTGKNIWETPDEGKSYQRKFTGNFKQVVVSPNKDIHALTSAGEVLRSENGKKQFESRGKQYILKWIAAAPYSEDQLWGVDPNGNLWWSKDKGKNYLMVNSGGGFTKLAVAKDKTLYALNTEGRVFRSKNEGKTFIEPNGIYRLSHLTVSEGKNVWGVDASGGIWFSIDEGLTFNHIPPPVPFVKIIATKQGNDDNLSQPTSPSQTTTATTSPPSVVNNTLTIREKLTLYGLDASGKIYKSTDGGFTFHLPGPPYRLTDIGLYSGSIGNGMWGIGTGKNIWESPDEGKSYQRKFTGNFKQVVVSPNKDIHALTSAGEVLRSENGKKQFESRGKKYIFSWIAAAPYSGDQLWGVDPNGNIWWSKDKGKSYRMVNSGGGYKKLFVAKDKTLYALNTEGRIFRSKNEGKTFIEPNRIYRLSHLTVSEGKNVWGVDASGGIWFSIDEGLTFNHITPPVPFVKIIATKQGNDDNFSQPTSPSQSTTTSAPSTSPTTTAPPTSTTGTTPPTVVNNTLTIREKLTLYGLDASGKIYKSTDAGFTFHLPGPPYRLTDIGLYSGSIGNGMWGIGTNKNIWESPNGGNSYQRKFTGNFKQVVVSPNKDIHALTSLGEVLRSENGKKQFESRGKKYIFSWIAAAPYSGDQLWGVDPNGNIWWSKDKGKSYKMVNSGGGYKKLFVAKDKTLYALNAEGRIFRSKNEGRTFAEPNSIYRLSHLTVSNEKNIWGIDASGNIWFSPDEARTFTQIPRSVPLVKIIATK